MKYFKFIIILLIAVTLVITACGDDGGDNGSGGGAGGDSVVDIAAIPGVAVPVRGAEPDITAIDTVQYTGTITWSPDDNTFAATTVYTAIIILTAKTGYTFKGVTENFFTVAGNDSHSNAADSGTVVAVFPATGVAPDVDVIFQNAEETGGTFGTTDSTALILIFDIDPTTLTEDKITVTGATKGALSISGTTRNLGISDITVANGESVSVTITSPAGYAITGTPKTAVVYRLVQNSVTFNKLSGTGGSDNVTATYGSTMPTATAPERIGFSFHGYWDAISGGTKYYNADMSSEKNWDKTENATLYARWITTAAYNLRDIGPAGGFIFYINPNAVMDGWKYLEAAPQSTEWTNKFWGKKGTLIGLFGKTAIGTGKNNTALIVAVLNEPPADSDRAAQLCDALSFGGYNDWFLPSKDELYEMCWVLHSRRYFSYAAQDNPAYGTDRVGGFTDSGSYWSSSENSTTGNGAWCQRFDTGQQVQSLKDLYSQVRAVRSF